MLALLSDAVQARMQRNVVRVEQGGQVQPDNKLVRAKMVLLKAATVGSPWGGPFILWAWNTEMTFVPYYY